jgi:hypothetical protein
MRPSSRLSRILILSTVLLASMFTGLPRIGYPAISKVAAQTTVSYVLSAFRTTGWNGTIPGPNLVASIGDTVALALSSADGYPHRFFVDVNNNGVPDCTSGPDKCQPTSFMSTASYSFPVDSATFTAGSSYHYYCAIHPNMVGTFKVNSAAPAAPDFTVSANPTSVSAPQGGSATSSISIASQNGFSGSLTLSTNTPSSGLSWKANPTGVTLTSGGTVTSILTVNASSTASTGAYQPGGGYVVAGQAGTYQAIVTVTNGTLMHSATVTVNVTSPGANASALGYLPEIGAAAIIGAIAIVGILWYRASRAKPKKRS